MYSLQITVCRGVLILPYKNGYLSTVCCDIAFHYLSKGAIPPHLPESNEQNLVVIEAFLEAAKRYARGGYDVIVDGIVGPWFLEPWRALVREDYEVHYIVLIYLLFISFAVVCVLKNPLNK